MYFHDNNKKMLEDNKAEDNNAFLTLKYHCDCASFNPYNDLLSFHMWFSSGDSFWGIK